MIKTLVLALPIAMAGLCASANTQNWSAYSSDKAQRHSPLNQINKDNVSRLEQVFTHSTGETLADGVYSLQATPLVVDGRMYYCSTKHTIFAVDATNGEELWKFQRTFRFAKKKPLCEDGQNSEEDECLAEAPHDYYEFNGNENNREARVAFNACRGVSYHKFAGEGQCSERIYTSLIDGRLFALDAKTGEPCTEFGESGVGFVDLHKGMGDPISHGLLELYYTTVPAIMTTNPETKDGLVVMGGSVQDNYNYNNTPSGVIRGFDLRTGELKWAWEPIPEGFHHDIRSGNEPDKYGIYQRGTPNAWSFITIDEETGMIYIPFGTPAPDYFIGLRPNVQEILTYGSSIVALNKDGEYVWHKQVIKNDIWDYDVPSQPNLVDFKVDGEDKKAVIVSTKAGHTFILDRMTGEPLFPLHQMKVPARAAAPGELALSPTQEVPSFPAPFYKHDNTINNTVHPDEEWLTKLESISPEAAASCREFYETNTSTNIFSPQTTEGTIQFPSAVGGNHWGGNSIYKDSNRKILVTNVNRFAGWVQLLDKQNPDCNDPAKLVFGGKAYDSPYCLMATFFKGNNGSADMPKDYFCTPPPWGEIMAFDLEAKKMLWKKPLGTYDGEAGSPNLGGTLTTASGIIFVGGSADKTFRAIDVNTGDVLKELPLPAHGVASPMTYMVNGEQYVAIAAGGHGWIDWNPSTFGNQIVVFKLGSGEPAGESAGEEN